MIDADLTKEMPWAAIRGAGYSHKFNLAAPIRLTDIMYSERPEFLYVTGDNTDCIHVFWFGDEGGTGEFDIVNGELKHVDCHGCNVSISGSTLIFSPHRQDGTRQLLGPKRAVPRNSEELFFATLGGNRREGLVEDSK
ncbi:hypothetical protein [Bradyrhizobium sp. LA2.1]|uniref:hypothetical protein n=1 Tax=Bradyrhizobium sp. LA2.1 TaxID=3156376 RepID=UPI0033959F4C